MFLFAALAGLVPGCLSPGGLDIDPLNVFQRRLAEAGAQDRLAERGLGLLQPVGKIGPLLVVHGEANSAGRWGWDDELKKWVPPPAAHGEPNRPEVWLSLKDAILRAVAQNPDIRVVSFDPEVSRQQMIEAAAAFDVVVFGSYQQQRTHELTRNTSIFSTDPFFDSRSENRLLRAGLKELTPTGGTWSLTYSMTRMWDNSTFSRVPVTYEPKVALEVAQPLLRDAWPRFNLARLRIAQTGEKMSQADFRTKVEQVVSDVVTAYWALWAARMEVPIRQQLLQYARDSLEKVKAREHIDATAVEIKQAEAAVMQRQVLLEVSAKAVGDAQDALMRLLADPQLNLLSGLQVNPVSPPSRSRVTLSEQGELENALKYNPVLDKARLAIALADINITVARNQALPRLDLTAAASYQGLARHSHEAIENMGTLDFMDYSLGISMEYPLGNRERLAELRRRRLERLKAVSQLQSVADEIAQAVKERLREIDRASREIELDRKVVQAIEIELQAIEELEKTRARLTPEFLRLKLDTQSGLAEARIAELRAVRGYNLAISDLARITGTILKQYQVDILLPAASGEAAWPQFDERPAPTTTGTQPAARRTRSAGGTSAVAAQ